MRCFTIKGQEIVPYIVAKDLSHPPIYPMTGVAPSDQITNVTMRVDKCLLTGANIGLWLYPINPKHDTDQDVLVLWQPKCGDSLYQFQGQKIAGEIYSHPAFGTINQTASPTILIIMTLSSQASMLEMDLPKHTKGVYRLSYLGNGEFKQEASGDNPNL